MSYFPTSNPNQFFIYTQTSQPQQPLVTQTSTEEALDVTAPLPAFDQVDALILTIPYLPVEEASNRAKHKRSASQMEGSEAERNKDGDKKTDSNNYDLQTTLFSPQIGGCQGIPSDELDPELLWDTTLRTMQNEVDYVNAFEVVPTLIAKLSTEEVIRIFAKMDGIHLWKRACILYGLNQKQRQEWNSILFSQQLTRLMPIPLKPNPIDANLIQSIRAHPIWKLDQQIQAGMGPWNQSSWCISYLAAYLLKNLGSANILLKGLEPAVFRQVVNLLLSKEISAQQIVDLFKHAADSLVLLVKEVESTRPEYFESIFAMSSLEICIKIGKELTYPRAISSAKAGLMGESSSLSYDEKEQVIFAIVLSKAHHGLKPGEIISLQMSFERGLGAKWLEESQIPNFFVHSDPDCMAVAKMLKEKFSPDEVKKFFSSISNPTAIVRLAEAFGSVELAINGILNNPACQNRHQEILAAIVSKKLEAAREQFFSRIPKSFKTKTEMYRQAILQMLPWLSEKVFLEEERVALLESGLILPFEVTWQSRFTICPKRHFILASKADLNAFLSKPEFSSVQSVWILSSKAFKGVETLTITHEAELNNLMQALNKCTRLTAVDLRGCSFSGEKLRLDVPLRWQGKDNKIQLRIFMQILMQIKSGISSTKVVDIHLGPNSILAGPEALHLKNSVTSTERGIFQNLQTVRCNLICSCFPPFSKFSQLELDAIQMHGIPSADEKLEELAYLPSFLKEFSWDNTDPQGQIDLKKLQETLLRVRQRCTQLECFNLRGFSLSADFFQPTFLRQFYAIAEEGIPDFSSSFSLMIDGKKFEPKFSVKKLSLRSKLQLEKLNYVELKDLKSLTCQNINSEHLRELARKVPQLESLSINNAQFSSVGSFFLFLCEFPQLKQVTVEEITVGQSRGLTLRPATASKIEELHLDETLANSQTFSLIPLFCPSLKTIELKAMMPFDAIMPVLQFPQIEHVSLDGLTKHPDKKNTSLFQDLEAFLQDQNCPLQISSSLKVFCISTISKAWAQGLTPLLQKRQPGIEVDQKLIVTNLRGLNEKQKADADNKIVYAIADHLTNFAQLPEDKWCKLASRLLLKAKEKIKDLKIAMPTVDIPSSLLDTGTPMVIPKTSLIRSTALPADRERFMRVKQALNPTDVESDVTLIVEGHPIFAHQAVLMRVDLFKDLFSKFTPEQVAGGLSFPWISYQNFLVLLEYFYTGQLSSELTIEQSCDLLNALEGFFPGKTNQTSLLSNQGIVVDEQALNDPLAMTLKYQIYNLCFTRDSKHSSNIFILVQNLDKLPSYLQRAVVSYLSEHWCYLNILSEGFKKMSRVQRQEISGIICAGLLKVSQILYGVSKTTLLPSGK